MSPKVESGRFEDGRWHVRTEHGEQESYDFLISACGVLHHPRMPSIEGLESFEGTSFHTARWDDGVQLAGKRVGLIGNGSTVLGFLCESHATAGAHDNVSGFVSAAQSGTNTGASGFATAPLTAIVPPVITKSFSPTSILAGIGVSAMTFQIANPNAATALSGVAFNDNFPSSPGAMTVASPATFSTSGCGSPVFTPVAGATSIGFSGGTIAAGGTCTVTVNVAAAAIGRTASALHIAEVVGDDDVVELLAGNARRLERFSRGVVGDVGGDEIVGNVAPLTNAGDRLELTEDLDV